MKKRDTRIRVALEFDKELIRKIQMERLRNGIDKYKPKSSRRITLAMYRHKDMERIATDIINSDLPE